MRQPLPCFQQTTWHTSGQRHNHLSHLNGYEDVYTRMRMLCQQEQEPTLLIGALGGLWTFYLNQAALQMAYEIAQQILLSAQHLSRTSLWPPGYESPRRPFLWGHVMLGQT